MFKEWSGSIYLCCAFILAGTSVVAARLVTDKLGAAMLLSVTLSGEVPGWLQWAGGVLIIAGMVLIGTDGVGVKRRCTLARPGKSDDILS